MGENAKDISDNTFDAEVLKSEIPVLVDFWAPWCAPCKSIAPAVEELAVEYAGRLKVVKVNIDDNPRAPERYNVLSIPKLVFFKKGEVVEEVIGAVAKSRLVEVIQKVI